MNRYALITGASRGITVNAVAPGPIETDMIRQAVLYTAERYKDMNTIPMQRLGKPEEVAYLVAFLCSDKADYISGQVIGINGGAV